MDRVSCLLCFSVDLEQFGNYCPEKPRRDHSSPEGTYAFKWAERIRMYTEREEDGAEEKGPRHVFVCVCVSPGQGADGLSLSSVISLTLA